MRKVIGLLLFASIAFVAAELCVTWLTEARLRHALQEELGTAASFRLNSFPATLSLAQGKWREAVWLWDGRLEGEAETPYGGMEGVVLDSRFSMRWRDFRWDFLDVLLGRYPKGGEAGEVEIVSMVELGELLRVANDIGGSCDRTDAVRGESLEFLMEDGKLAVYAKCLDSGSNVSGGRDLNERFRLIFRWRPQSPPFGSRLGGCKVVRETLELNWVPSWECERGSFLKQRFMEVEVLSLSIEGLENDDKAQVKCWFFLEKNFHLSLDRQDFVV